MDRSRDLHTDLLLIPASTFLEIFSLRGDVPFDMTESFPLFLIPSIGPLIASLLLFTFMHIGSQGKISGSPMRETTGGKTSVRAGHWQHYS